MALQHTTIEGFRLKKSSKSLAVIVISLKGSADYLKRGSSVAITVGFSRKVKCLTSKSYSLLNGRINRLLKSTVFVLESVGPKLPSLRELSPGSSLLRTLITVSTISPCEFFNRTLTLQSFLFSCNSGGHSKNIQPSSDSPGERFFWLATISKICGLKSSLTQLLRLSPSTKKISCGSVMGRRLMGVHWLMSVSSSAS
ncbi:MAG: hypothetical protein QOH25_742 [Acidobacteriota bacterium]|nr:hypothetical protein [Acidobacteriota bacterium]